MKKNCVCCCYASDGLNYSSEFKFLFSLFFTTTILRPFQIDYLEIA